MRAIGLHVQKCLSSLALTPTRPVQHPRASRNPPMLLLPPLYVLDGQQEVGRLLHLLCRIDYAGRADKFARWNAIGRVVGQIFDGNPVDGSVKVRARVFAQIENIPVPTGTTAIIA